MTECPSLPEIIKNESKWSYVVLTPTTEDPINITVFFDFSDEMRDLAKQFGLKSHYRGAGHSLDLESAAKEKGSLTDKRYHEFYAKFKSKFSAYLFLVKVNETPSISYTAEIPEDNVGITRFVPIKKLN